MIGSMEVRTVERSIDILDRKAALEHVQQLLGVPEDVSLGPFIHQHPPVLKGNHLYCQGDQAGDVYLLLDGTLKAYQVTHDGEESIIRFCFPGEVLWTSGFQAHARSTSVVALEKSHLVSMADSFLQHLMSDHECVQRRCFQLLSKIIKDEQAFIHLLAVGNADRRVAYLLLHIWKHRSATGCNDAAIHIPMTRSDMGRYLGLSEETVSRVFSRLQNLGMIEIHHPDVKLRDLSRLRRLADGDETPVTG